MILPLLPFPPLPFVPPLLSSSLSVPRSSFLPLDIAWQTYDRPSSCFSLLPLPPFSSSDFCSVKMSPNWPIYLLISLPLLSSVSSPARYSPPFPCPSLSPPYNPSLFHLFPLLVISLSLLSSLSSLQRSQSFRSVREDWLSWRSNSEQPRLEQTEQPS